MRKLFVESLVRVAEADDRIILLSGDLGYGALEPFIDRFPSRFINAGVAEQNMIGVATGLARLGLCPVVYSIGNFPTLRALEQIRNDAAYHDANVKIVSAGTGLTYGSAGFSHYATEDIGVMRAMPGVRLFAPADAEDIMSCTEHACSVPGVAYLRLGRGTVTLPSSMSPFRQGFWRWAGDGNDVALLGSGEVLTEVAEAHSILQAKGLSCRIVNCNQLSSVSDDAVLSSIADAEQVVVVEEHVASGGIGELVAAALARANWQGRVSMLAILDSRIKMPGSPQFLRKRFGVDAASIVEAVAKP